jgi:hypothetical protein
MHTENVKMHINPLIVFRKKRYIFGWNNSRMLVLLQRIKFHREIISENIKNNIYDSSADAIVVNIKKIT